MIYIHFWYLLELWVRLASAPGAQVKMLKIEYVSKHLMINT